MAREIMYREALNEALKEEMRRDQNVFLMGEGIAERGGSYKVTVGLLEEFGSKRVLDTPISEASFTGAGIGAAITGMRPVVEILFVDFTMLIMDQLVNQAAKYRFMSGGKPVSRWFSVPRGEWATAWPRSIPKAWRPFFTIFRD